MKTNNTDTVRMQCYTPSGNFYRTNGQPFNGILWTENRDGSWSPLDSSHVVHEMYDASSGQWITYVPRLTPAQAVSVAAKLLGGYRD